MLDYISKTISALALVISLVAMLNTRAATVKEFFMKIDSTEHKGYRKKIYEIKAKPSDEFVRIAKDSDEIAQVIATYDLYARLVRYKYLPLWAFKGMSGYVASNIFKIVTPYIDYRRTKGHDENNPNFAANYQWLVNKIDKKDYANK